ncbi:MAG TPA: 3'-5' exonuclease, partial [Blastocatellia bacterium]|nr:3'-5' exonuclease [Blastocatellia bacterium]
FEESLRRRGLKYNIVGGFSFYERAEVKDIIAYLKVAMNPNDDISLARIINTPPRGLGKTRLEAIAAIQKDMGVGMWEAIAHAIETRALGDRVGRSLTDFRMFIQSLGSKIQSGAPLSDVVRDATIGSGYVEMLSQEKNAESEGRLLNVEELVNAAAEAERRNETLRDFIDHAALVSDTDQYRPDAQVTLMTMHSAKGLEFPVVFIAGLEEGLFPNSRSIDDEGGLEEERRLCYVGITRAKQRLYLTHAMRRRTFGEESPAEPSRFLNEVPPELIENLSPGGSWLKFKELPDEYYSKAESRSPARTFQDPIKRTSNYKGKTYDSTDAVREFFNKKGLGGAAQQSSAPGTQDAGTSRSRGKTDTYKVGTRVKHARYGRGVILQCDGAGDDAKLTVSFPGFGQKKFVAKFAGLEKL